MLEQKTHWTFHMVTFGCKVNQYEIQAIREAWLACGAVEMDQAFVALAEDESLGDVHADGLADTKNSAPILESFANVVLINSCAVTARAITDLRQYINRLHRIAPLCRILVTGCAAQILAPTIAEMAGVEAVISQEGKDALCGYNPDSLRDDNPLQNHQLASCFPTGPLQKVNKKAVQEKISIDCTEAHAKNAEEMLVPQKSLSYSALRITDFKRARPVVKVQDGCSHGCTYCIVPLARGRSRSREAHDIIAELRTLLAAGFREIMLSGINLRQYGRDLEPRINFWNILQMIERELAPEWHGTARIRLSSLEPGQMGDEALETLVQSRLVCPHLHISLQSGSYGVLRRMGRGHYKPAPLLDFLEKLHEIWPTYALGADILMGFPQESEAEYTETLDVVRAMPLTYAHVFPFSRRPHTVAAVMDGQIPREIKKVRAAAVRSLISEKKALFIESLKHRHDLSVVLDGHGSHKGVTQYYVDCHVVDVPENHDARALLNVYYAGHDGDSDFLVRPM
ncbi:MAG: radical SAM protein [Pseudomonadota bacterium]